MPQGGMRIPQSPSVTAPFRQGGLCRRKGERYMKATGIVRRVDDLGRIVIPKEIRRTLRIREGDPSYTTLISSDLFIRGILAFGDRVLGSKH